MDPCPSKKLEQENQILHRSSSTPQPKKKISILLSIHKKKQKKLKQKKSMPSIHPSSMLWVIDCNDLCLLLPYCSQKTWIHNHCVFIVQATTLCGPLLNCLKFNLITYRIFNHTGNSNPPVSEAKLSQGPLTLPVLFEVWNNLTQSIRYRPCLVRKILLTMKQGVIVVKPMPPMALLNI